MKRRSKPLRTSVAVLAVCFLLLLVAVSHTAMAQQSSSANSVTFTFENGNNGTEGGNGYGTPDGNSVLVRNGFEIDVQSTGGASGGRHFHELDSTLSGKVPDRPFAERGVLWRDGWANLDPLFFKPTDPQATFALESLVAGTTSADNAAASVKLTGFFQGNIVASIILTPPVDGYASYSAGDLGALQGATLDRLEFLAVGNSETGYYMLDNVVLNVTTNTSITMGPQAMEGDLRVSAGDTLQVGYDFTMPGSHPATTVGFVQAEVTFPYTCIGTVGSGSFTVPIANQSYSDPANNSAWYPSGDQHSPAVFQGSFTIPSTLCGSGLVRLNQGGTFDSGVTASPSGYKVNMRWHYSANGSAGGWSGTKSIVPN